MFLHLYLRRRSRNLCGLVTFACGAPCSALLLWFHAWEAGLRGRLDFGC